MRRSALYLGDVAHARPGKHRLRYRVFMLALDLDELADLDGVLRLFAHNRSALISLHDRDCANRRPEPIRPQIEAVLHEAGLGGDWGRLVLVTMPRVLNYVFNPLSLYFCYRRDGDLAALVHEVSNTFGERHFYALPAHEHNGRIIQACDKAFFVSPFLEPHLRYAFDVTPPGAALRIAIVARRGEEIALTASFSGARHALNDGNILRAWAGNPLLTFKVIAGIHWEALKMMMKGVRYIGRAPAPPASEGATP